jgi:hypothetical protein
MDIVIYAMYSWISPLIYPRLAYIIHAMSMIFTTIEKTFYNDDFQDDTNAETYSNMDNFDYASDLFLGLGNFVTFH